jgi:regulator of sirC expression with transglutaminase-like and TPR domain
MAPAAVMDVARETWREDFVKRIETDPDPPLMESVMALSRYLQGGDVWDGADELLAELEDDALTRCSDFPPSDSDARAAAIMSVLSDHGFEGNDQDYEDVGNSFIDRVLESRRGLPITLGVLSLHLAEVCGVDMRGIGFPGHFLVGAGLKTPLPSIFDPFNGGQRLGFPDLAALYRAATGRQMTSAAPLLREALRPVRNRDVLSRMLRNLQHHYTLRGSHDRAADVVELLVTLHPEMDKLREVRRQLHRRLETLN